MLQLIACAERWKSRVDFVTVYIREAHAADEWPLGDIVCIKQHTSIEERIAAAQQLRDSGYTLPLVVDSMENQVESSYAAWPERYVVIGGDGDVRFISYPTTKYGFVHADLETALETEFGQSK
eukprot:TRINITY_DN24003_c0_g1_i1.p2 TRINITY_DN24003_c0_g1~~TRINITY_DN24003_c0_g1_i1.p2  ORF type:complete len:123 (-),score=5.64 TRINITY_DN24003_c0_g1_i1:71-439(-)